MSDRKNENGFPFMNDPTKVAAIAEVIVENLTALLDPSKETYLQCFISEHAEYDGLTNGEYWLAVQQAAMRLNADAFKHFTDLVTDKEEEDFDVDEFMAKFETTKVS